jgi:hypothetical protein
LVRAVDLFQEVPLEIVWRAYEINIAETSKPMARRLQQCNSGSLGVDYACITCGHRVWRSGFLY